MILGEAIDMYVGRKQACGFSFAFGQRILYSFRNRIGNPLLDRVSAKTIQAFLDSPRTSRGTWRSKYSLLKHFFEFCHLQGELPELPLPPSRPPQPSIFTPYIYSRAEIRSLLRATRQCQRSRFCKVDSATFRCFLLTLYGTGAMIGELLNLRAGDISFKHRRMTLSGNRIIEARTIPICSDLLEELKAFASLKHQKKNAERHFFCTRDDRPLTQGGVNGRFNELRQLTAVKRHAVFYQPRMHDLRSTFAVHRITSWIKDGADLNRVLPALAAYMGIASLATTERYLALTPERFRKTLQKLSRQRRYRRWRDDPALMKFLAGL